MAKVQGPLFSLTARGTVGDALTYAAWRGVPYVRTRVVPANPQTALQTAVRDPFRTLNNMWNRMPTLGRAPWTASALGQPFTDRNRFLGFNVPLLQGDALPTDYRGSPGAGSAVPPLTMVPSTPGAGQITLTFTQPALPPGWTQQAVVGQVFVNFDPSPPVDPLNFAAEDAVTPFTIVLFTGLAAGTYQVRGWNRLVGPDLLVRYSIDLIGTQVVA